MKKTNRYIGNGEEIYKELEKVSYSIGFHNIFSDWIDLILNSLLSLTENITKENFMEKLKRNKLGGRYEKRYLGITEKYKSDKKIGERPIDYLCSAWINLLKETIKKQEDILGEIYMQKITRGEAGQFFTPTHITNMMAEMVSEIKGKVSDPCCGSGRFLISASKKNKNAEFHGIDLDDRCVKMCAINMWIFNLNAKIKLGDSLSNKFYKQYIIKKGGYIYETDL